VNVDSPSGGQAQETVAELVAGWLHGLGGRVEWSPEPDGPARTCVVALQGAGRGVVALLGHTDTVFGPGTAAERPFRREGERCFGPGVADMKGGLVLAAMAVERLAERRRFRELRLVLCPDEEIRLRAPAAIERARGAAAALVFECARENGHVVSARKGAVWRRMRLTGRPAHAGADTARGRSAVSALAAEVLRIEALAAGRPHMTSVVTTVQGGEAANSVPATASATIDIRSSVPVDLERAERALVAGGPYDGVTIEIDDRGTWPPMPRADWLVEEASRHQAELGLPVGHELSGGVSDGCWTGACGIPTLDGLGPRGALDHTPDEWIEVASLPERVELAVRLVESAGARSG
jgi:glutamate carboxypeptidase